MNSEVKAIALSLQQAILGYGFRPSDEELINYLKSEVPGCRGGFCIIPTLEDIYKINPWHLPDKFNEQSDIPPNGQDWWFVGPQIRGQRIGRKTPCGSSWKITGKHKDVKAKNDDKKQIGYKITLVFEDGEQTNWVIHEYHLLDSDMNRDYVLFHLNRRRDEKADSSTTESGHGANVLGDFASFFLEPDHEELFSEDLIQAQMNSLRQNIDGQSVMDFTLENDPDDECIQLASETSEEAEDVDFLLNGDFIDDDFFLSNQMQTEYGQASNLHSDHPVVMENRRTRPMDSLHGVLPLDEKKGMVQNKCNGSLVAPEKTMVPPVRTASVKYHGKNEVLWSEKVKQETAAKSFKPECAFFDETAARAKVKLVSAAKSIKPESVFFDDSAARAKTGQISMVENSQTRKIGSLHGVDPLEQKKGVIQSKLSSSHISSANSMELPKRPKTPTTPEPPRIYASRNVRPEYVSLHGAAATAKVQYREHCSASNIPRKTNSAEIEPVRENPKSATASTKPSSKSTNSTNPPLAILLAKMLVGVFLFLVITCSVLGF